MERPAGWMAKQVGWAPMLSPGRPPVWRGVDHIEAATLDWVHWYNTEGTHEAKDDLTPVQAEQLHHHYRASPERAG
jgi:transposase InsO family protein